MGLYEVVEILSDWNFITQSFKIKCNCSSRRDQNGLYVAEQLTMETRVANEKKVLVLSGS